MKIAYAPSKSRDFVSRGLHHLPLIKSFVKKREITRFVGLARSSAERKQNFIVLHSGWARKTNSFDTENVLSKLANIDKINRTYILPGVLQSSHWSRIYEYPYAAYQLRDTKKGGRVLDCGCGVNSFQFYLAEKGFEVHSVDPYLPSLEKAANMKKQLGLSNLKPTFGSILKLPFADSYFDGATCISVLEHTLISSENSKLMLKGSINEMLRVLRKNALLVLTFDVNFGKGRGHLTLDEYAELCSMLGIETTALPEDRLFSSDTKEGLLMGKDFAVYSVTLAKT
ncbi:MAG: class I SAM-dependent methyltransferase [Candidatus Bathyarchaeia archaeon]